MTERVGRADLPGDIEADPLRLSFSDEVREVGRRRKDVVGPALFQEVTGDSEGGALDPVAATVGEDVEAVVGCVPLTEVGMEIAVVGFAGSC